RPPASALNLSLRHAASQTFSESFRNSPEWLIDMPLKISSLRLLMKIVILIILSIGPWIFSEAQSSSSAPVTAILTGLSFPISLKFAPDGRIFFNEKNTGNIRIIQQNGTILSSPFATISPIFTDDESGLLGMALDPSFTSNGYVYVYFTYRDGLS